MTTHSRTDNSRVIRAARGTQLSAKSWLTEAALRMLMNNLDPEVAERPGDLVVYGGIGRAARDWKAYDQIVAALKVLEADETLLVQSGKPVGVFKTHADAPRVLIANSNLVPKWATWEHFHELDRKGLMMYGQMTAGSWIYIGSQGIVQGTYETFVEAGRQHFPDGPSPAANGGRSPERTPPGLGRPCARARATVVLAAGFDEGLVGALHDALAADVDPGAGRHLAVHHQALAVELVEVFPGGPLGHQVRIRDQHARRIDMGAEHAHRLARLHQQRLVFIQRAQAGQDGLITVPVARRLADAAVDHQRVGIFRDLGVEVVLQHAVRRFDEPVLAGDGAAARCAHRVRARDVLDAGQIGHGALRMR